MVLRTAEEALAIDQAVLGLEYGSAYFHSCQELWRVSSTWDVYQTLFGSRERVDLINQSSGNFWHRIQGMMHEHILLGICKLTDPATTRKDRNLSVLQLAELEPRKNKKRLIQSANRAVVAARFARTWRHKRIAHNDFEQMLGTANKLHPSTGLKIKRAIIAINDVLNRIQLYHFGGNLGLVGVGDDEAIELMTVIDDGLKYKALREADHKAGQLISKYDYTHDWLETGPDPHLRYERNPRSHN